MRCGERKATWVASLQCLEQRLQLAQLVGLAPVRRLLLLDHERGGFDLDGDLAYRFHGRCQTVRDARQQINRRCTTVALAQRFTHERASVRFFLIGRIGRGARRREPDASKFATRHLADEPGISQPRKAVVRRSRIDLRLGRGFHLRHDLLGRPRFLNRHELEDLLRDGRHATQNGLLTAGVHACPRRFETVEIPFCINPPVCVVILFHRCLPSVTARRIRTCQPVQPCDDRAPTDASSSANAPAQRCRSVARTARAGSGMLGDASRRLFRSYSIRTSSNPFGTQAMPFG
ncbi:hypothetical protein X962_5577 [Burkholderia pseudomallei MSHR7343]|nr:hypothetical protein X962_5577 [Burkholderia pseudomallei MSHR7343]